MRVDAQRGASNFGGCIWRFNTLSRPRFSMPDYQVWMQALLVATGACCEPCFAFTITDMTMGVEPADLRLAHGLALPWPEVRTRKHCDWLPVILGILINRGRIEWKPSRCRWFRC